MSKASTAARERMKRVTITPIKPYDATGTGGGGRVSSD